MMKIIALILSGFIFSCNNKPKPVVENQVNILDTLKHTPDKYDSIVEAAQRRDNPFANQNDIYHKVYINEFKLDYYKLLFVAANNNYSAAKQILDLDHSGFTEPMLTQDDYALIKKLVYADNKLMNKDSADRMGSVAEGAEGKHTFQYIMNKLNSKWLDSLAEARYIIYLTNYK